MASRKEGSGAAGSGFGASKGKGKAATTGDSAVKQVQIDGLWVSNLFVFLLFREMSAYLITQICDDYDCNELYEERLLNVFQSS